MLSKIHRGRVLPVLLFGSLVIVAISVIFIGLQTPKDQAPQDTMAKENALPIAKNASPIPKPLKLYEYSSSLLGVTFKLPVEPDVVADSSKEFVLGVGENPEIILSTFESVPIRKLRLCEFDDSSACIYDGYSDQEHIFNPFELDGEKAKSFYYKDENGVVWKVVSLSVYKEFQIKMLEKYDKYYDVLIDSFDFHDNNS